MPSSVKEKYRDLNNIKIIDKVIPWEELEREFITADIFLLPVHNTPFSVFLEAMSYELPIVTIDAWANSEIIQGGKTGLLAKKSKKIPYYIENSIPNFGVPSFKKALRTPDNEVVADLVANASTLIENEDLRKTMGKAGRWEIENGRFSIAKRQEKLKMVFDEATEQKE